MGNRFQRFQHDRQWICRVHERRQEEYICIYVSFERHKELAVFPLEVYKEQTRERVVWCTPDSQT